MIWITGDKHGEIEEFQTAPYKKIKKRDTVIVCGDFGFIWENSKEEKKHLRWLSKRKYTIAFVEGNHENLQQLMTYPMVDFAGAKARQIAPNIYYLVRSQVYTIEGKTFLAFGGGANPPHIQDFHSRPSPEEERQAMENVRLHGGRVDVIISHEPPFSIRSCMETGLADSSGYIHDVLERIRRSCSFSHWFFGKYHIDKVIPPYYRAVFNDLIPLRENQEKKR